MQALLPESFSDRSFWLKTLITAIGYYALGVLPFNEYFKYEDIGNTIWPAAGWALAVVLVLVWGYPSDHHWH